MAAVRTEAVLLRAHDYGDSSRILRFYTRSHGLVSVVARGVRGRTGKGATTLASFASGELSAFVKPHRDLHTMQDFHCSRVRTGLAGEMLRFAGASAVAELVLVHTEQEPHPAVFDALERTLDRLEHALAAELPGTVLAALWSITEAFGFAPQLDPCVRCDEPLGHDEIGRFDFAAGGIRCAACGQDAAGARLGPGARGQLESLLSGQIPAGLAHPRRHLGLVSDFMAYHVVSRPLRSLHFLGGLMPPDAPREAPAGGSAHG
jgi:DNA repair protein RecO (recombination protein O)